MTLPVVTFKVVGAYETGPTVLLPSGEAFAFSGSGLTEIYTPPSTSDPTGLGSWTQGPSFPTDTSTSPKVQYAYE